MVAFCYLRQARLFLFLFEMGASDNVPGLEHPWATTILTVVMAPRAACCHLHAAFTIFLAGRFLRSRSAVRVHGNVVTCLTKVATLFGWSLVNIIGYFIVIITRHHFALLAGIPRIGIRELMSICHPSSLCSASPSTLWMAMPLPRQCSTNAPPKHRLHQMTPALVGNSIVRPPY